MSIKSVFSEDIWRGSVLDAVWFSAAVTVDFMPLNADYKKKKAFSF